MDKYATIIIIIILLLTIFSGYIIYKRVNIGANINLHGNTSLLRTCENKLWMVPGIETYNTTCLLTNGATITTLI